LHGTQVPGPTVDQGRLGPTQRVCAVEAGVQADAADPARHEARVLAGRDAPAGAAAPREEEFAWPLARELQVGINCLASLLRQFESHRPAGLLLAHAGSVDRDALRRDVLDPEAHDVTAAELAVDGEIEHGKVAGAALEQQLAADRPDVLGPQRRLGAGQLSFVRRDVRSGRRSRFRNGLHSQPPTKWRLTIMRSPGSRSCLFLVTSVVLADHACGGKAQVYSEPTSPSASCRYRPSVEVTIEKLVQALICIVRRLAVVFHPVTEQGHAGLEFRVIEPVVRAGIDDELDGRPVLAPTGDLV
jgi:hypothetical protein